MAAPAMATRRAAKQVGKQGGCKGSTHYRQDHQQWAMEVSTNDTVPLAGNQPRQDGGTGEGMRTAAAM